MYKTLKPGFLALVLLIVVMLGACSAKSEPSVTPAAASSEGEGGADQPLTKVKIQLKWVPQAQFAGIYAAKEKGFFADEGIDAEIIPGGPDIVIEQQVVNGAADVGITGVDSLLVSRDNGLPLVSLAQISQKSSYRLIAKKSAGITDPAQMKGKKVSTWFGSQQFQVLAFMEKNGLDPKKDIELVKQGFTMDQFFNDQVDVATATIYNEYHVVLESGTKESDLDVFNIEDAGVGMLEDTLIAKKDWVDSNKELAVKVTRAVLKGWNYAIDNQNETVDIVMKNVTDGSTTREHQVTMLEEIAKLIRPEGFTEKQVGSFVDESFTRTADIALKYGLIKKAANLNEALEKSIYEEAVK
ncbi:ABC transporter substrate-binding protein [Paenibacillus sp. FSL K6-0108]|uniref:ABC transporter substrate-binding protein n=1 Tax=Paenibacillus sp. FSL K6-0108 TaxID=2921417 RepID=UPI0032455CFF